MKRCLLVLVVLLCACEPAFNTRSVVFDRQVSHEMPYEKAADVVEGFTYATAYEGGSTCGLSGDGVMNKDTGRSIPYDGTCFTVRHSSNEFIYQKVYATIIDRDGLDFCKIQVSDEAEGQQEFDRLFNYFGTALISLGSEYCPDKE